MSGNPYADDVPEEYNPFQAPRSTDQGESFAGSDVDGIRRTHLSHEASIKSVGTLYLLGGGLMLLGSIFGLAFRLGGGAGQPGIDPNDLGVFAFLFLFGTLLLATAIGLRQLRRWARIVSGINSALGLLGFPIGTLISAYILYLLFSAKGTMIFSDEYKNVIQQTPHIVYKTSIIVRIFLFLLLGVLALGVVAALFG